MRDTTIGGFLLIIIGVVMIFRGLMAKYLYIDTEGTIPQEEMQPASPGRRVFAACVGLVAVGAGVYNILR